MPEYIEYYKNTAKPLNDTQSQPEQFLLELSNNRKNYNLEGSKGFNTNKNNQYGATTSNHVVLQPDTIDYKKLFKKPVIGETNTPRIKYFN